MPSNETEFGYRKLQQGDRRQLGDEVRQDLGGNQPLDCQGYVPIGREKYVMRVNAKHRKHAPWLPVSLVGHEILGSDLMVAEFRRPIL